MFALFKYCFLFFPLDVLCVPYAQIFPNPLSGIHLSVLGVLEGVKSAASSHFRFQFITFICASMLNASLIITLVTFFCCFYL